MVEIPRREPALLHTTLLVVTLAEAPNLSGFDFPFFRSPPPPENACSCPPSDLQLSPQGKMKYEEESPSGKLVLAWEDWLQFVALKKKQLQTSRSSNLKELKMVRKAFEIFFLLLREQLKMWLWKQWRKTVKETVPFAIYRITQTPRILWGFSPYFLFASHFHLLSYFSWVP